MPPLHPALIHFPIALVVFSLAMDLLGIVFSNSSLRATGLWSLTVAAIMMVAAIASGYYDMNRASLTTEVDGYVHLHLRIGWVAFVAITLLTVWRWCGPLLRSSWQEFAYGVAGFIVVALVAFQAWYGGEMVYVHGASVASTGQGVENFTSAKRRLHSVYEFLGSPHGEGHERK